MKDLCGFEPHWIPVGTRLVFPDGSEYVVRESVTSRALIPFDPHKGAWIEQAVTTHLWVDPVEK